MAILTKESIMCWGKHKGKALKDIPAGYLVWLHDSYNYDHDVGVYLRNNIDEIREKATVNT